MTNGAVVAGSYGGFYGDHHGGRFQEQYCICDILCEKLIEG